MTEEDFFQYITLLKKSNELELIDSVLKMNKSILSIDPFLESMFRDLITIHNKAFKKEIIKRAKNVITHQSEMSSEPRKRFFSECLNLFDIENEILTNTYETISPDKYIKRICLSNINKTEGEKRSFKILEYHNIHTLETGDKFGELAFENTILKRTASIITTEECHFGILEKKSYESILKLIYEKQKKVVLNFFLLNKIFFGCDKQFFSKKFENFVKEKIYLSKFLLNENKNFDSIYFVKKGEFKISFHKSIIELNDLINYFHKKLHKTSIINDEKFNKNDYENEKGFKFSKFINSKQVIKVNFK